MFGFHSSACDVMAARERSTIGKVSVGCYLTGSSRMSLKRGTSKSTIDQGISGYIQDREPIRKCHLL